MNRTEEVALSWIVKTSGFPRESIRYSNNTSPDFVTPDDIGYEVKRAINHKLTIDIRQWDSLAKFPNCYILICNKSMDIEDSIPIQEIKIGNHIRPDTMCHNYIIHFSNERKNQMTRDEWKIIKSNHKG